MPRSESIIGSRNCNITHSHTFAARMQITTGSAKFSKVSFAQIITRAAAQRHKSLREVWKAYNYLPGFYERSYFYCWTPRPLYSQHYAMNKHVFAAATRTRSDASLRQLREGEWERERARGASLLCTSSSLPKVVEVGGVHGVGGVFALFRCG